MEKEKEKKQEGKWRNKGEGMVKRMKKTERNKITVQLKRKGRERKWLDWWKEKEESKMAENQRYTEALKGKSETRTNVGANK